MEIIERFLYTDGLTKPATPKSKNQETSTKLKRQEVMFTATPPRIKRVLQPDSSEMVKPQKQLKRSIGAEKDSDERIPIKENKENKGIDRKTAKTTENKFRQKIKIRNVKELFQKFPTKEDLNKGYLKEHFKNYQIIKSEINKTENYVILALSNIQCFNKLMKDWPEHIIKKDQLKIFEKDMRPTLRINKIPENMKIETVKNIILNCGLHPENVHRLKRKYGNPTTLVLFKLKNEGEEQHVKSFGIKIDNKIKNIREYVNKEKIRRRSMDF